MSDKDTNPKDALSIGKVPLHCVSCAVLLEVGLGMMEGGRKYGTHNYRSMGVLASVYYDAAIRHLMDWWEGEDIDPDSGLSHVSKALACLSVLRDSMLMENWKDDRPIRLPNGLDIDRLNAHATEIIKKYPESKAPYIQAGVETEQTSDEPRYMRAGQAWESYEDATLQSEVACGATVIEMAKDHQRTEVAIFARLNLLGINYDFEDITASAKVDQAETDKALDCNADLWFSTNPSILCQCNRCQTRRDGVNI